jgi:hypothetical protein
MSQSIASQNDAVSPGASAPILGTNPNRVASRIRFQFALVLYLGWLGYLAWQVAITRFPNGPAPVLSRSQWAGTDAEVVGIVTGSDELQIKEVLYAPADLPLAKGNKISVIGLDAAQRAPKMVEDKEGDLWLVPLRKRGDGFLVAPIPSAPGFRAGAPGEEIGRIYHYSEPLKLHAKAVRREVFPEGSKTEKK